VSSDNHLNEYDNSLSEDAEDVGDALSPDRSNIPSEEKSPSPTNERSAAPENQKDPAKRLKRIIPL
jgi:hypothetical protein